MNPAQTPITRRRKRTIELWVLIVGMLFLSVWGWLRLQQALFYGDYLNRFGNLPPVVYLALSGFCLGAAALASGVGLWLAKTWAVWLTRIVVPVSAVGYWVERLVFTHSTDGWTNFLFMALFTVFCVGYALLVLESPRQKDYFG